MPGGHGHVRLRVSGHVTGAGRRKREGGMHDELATGQPDQGAAPQQVGEQQDATEAEWHGQGETAQARQAPRGGDVRGEPGRDLRDGGGGGARTTQPRHRD